MINFPIKIQVESEGETHPILDYYHPPNFTRHRCKFFFGRRRRIKCTRNLFFCSTAVLTQKSPYTTQDTSSKTREINSLCHQPQPRGRRSNFCNLADPTKLALEFWVVLCSGEWILHEWLATIYGRKRRRANVELRELIVLNFYGVTAATLRCSLDFAGLCGNTISKLK